MSKAEILSNIRHGLGRGSATAEQKKAAMKRIQAHKATIIPKRSQLDQAGQIKLFREMASGAAAELIDIHHLSQLPAAVSEWLKKHDFSTLVSASDECLNELDWAALGDIQREQRIAQSGDVASLTTSMAGIAETGTLMLYSRPESPTTLNFLPDCHLVLLKESDIVGSYEDAWNQLRRKHPDSMPRTVNMITGPSRSADIGQKLQMGAHGPCVLVIFVLKDV
ncbi:LUD domain-containing protein [uncultured Neptuniibacter sp.]|uniref:LutC/YkgG family protein n=1 Tax=uncultured Neptuniibacter sp. TaxID=502143 RepID=UPI00260F1E97|nr:LUD domain-containing protein [uncultured Neptuniibacter sp.]